jgi:hypothetical protein
VVKLADQLFVACALAVALSAGAVAPGKAQELPVPCYAFQQDALGNWIATEALSMNTPVGTVDITPGHRVSVPVANILNARCP